MRKNFTWLILLLAVSVANAQEVYRISEAQAEQMMRTSKMVSNDHMSNKAETEVAGRVFWVDDWAITNTFDGDDYRNVYTIFPDKIQALYWNVDEQEEEVAEVNWNSAGISFDPKDNTWFDPNLPKIRDWHNYTIDSVFFQFGYLRRSHDSIVDKIIVQAYKGNQLLRRAGTGSAAGKSATVGYNSSKGEGTNQSDSIHVTLTADDSSTVNRTTGTFSVRTVGIPLNEPLEMTAGEIFGVTINFESGVTDFDSDDTLYMDPRLYNKYDTIQQTRLNTMFVSGRLQSDYNDLSSPVSALESFNNGMFISRRISGTNRPTRYSSGGSYIYPGDVPVAFYPRIGVHYSAKFDVGLDENTVDGYGLGDVYPNPAPKGTELNLSFAVNSRENVTITVYDLTGKKVMDIVDGQYEAGKHKTSFNASELESGMYLYTMTAGTYSKTERFTVNN